VKECSGNLWASTALSFLIALISSGIDVLRKISVSNRGLDIL